MFKQYYKFYTNSGRPLPRLFQDVNQANYQASKNYLPKVYSNNIIFFNACDIFPWRNQNPEVGWRKLVTGGITAHTVPGNHNEVFEEPHVKYLAKKLDEYLYQAQASITNNRFNQG